MKISTKTIFEVVTAIVINLTSAWFTIIFITPGFFNSSTEDFLRLLTTHLPFGIFGFIGAIILSEKTKKL